MQNYTFLNEENGASSSKISSRRRALSLFQQESTSLLLERHPTIDFDTRNSSWIQKDSIKKDKVGDAWHNMTTGFDTGVLNYPILSLIPSIIVTAIIWNLEPWKGLTSTSMHALGVFIGFVIALLISHYEVSALVCFALAILSVSKNFMCLTAGGKRVDCHLCGQDDYFCDGYKDSFKVAVSGMTSDIVWLVFCAFHIGKAVEVSGLGKRIALHLVSLMGKTPIGLATSFCFAEFLLAPFIPSNSARGGGVIAPIVTSVIDVINAENVGSPELNAFLIMVAAQANLVSSSIFLTGQAPNPLVSEKAYHALHIRFGFMQWLTGSFVPGFITLLIIPFILTFLLKPKAYQSDVLIETIHQRLDSLGSLTWREWKLITVLLTCLTLWSTEGHTGLNNALIAFLAIVVMILADIITWDDISKNTKAWDTLFWLGGFVVIAEQLSYLNVTDWLGNKVSLILINNSFTPFQSTIALSMIYFFSMYMFSSATGHIVALAGPFLEAGATLKCPPFLITALLAYFGALCCCMTSYSTGSSAIYYGQGHIPRGQWFRIGFIMAIFYMAVYFSLGMIWWKVIGWW